MSLPKKDSVSAFFAALAVALYFVLLELIKAHRSSQWSGMDAAGWAWAGAGLALYFAVLFLAVLALERLLSFVWRRERGGEGRWIAPGAAAGVALWCFLSLFREHVPTPDDAIVLAGIAAFGLGWPVLHRLGRFSFPEYTTCCVVVLATGIAAVPAVNSLCLFEANRSYAVTVYPLAWTLGIAVTLLAVWTTHRRWFQIIGSVLAVIALPLGTHFATTTSAPDEDAPPNLVLVVSDSMRSDYLSAYGGPVPTPHLEALASEGVRFARSYSLAPWTMPSMSALFSSAYPPSLSPGASQERWLTEIWRYHTNPESALLAETLQARGYTNGAMTANALLWVLPYVLRGFDVDARSHPITTSRYGPLMAFPFLQDVFAVLCPSLLDLRPRDCTADLNRYSRAFLRRHREKPFFLWVHHIDPHAPYAPPKRFREMEGPWPFFYPFPGGERWGVPQLGLDFTVAEEHRPYVRSLYEGELRYMDESVGKLMDWLEELGLRDNTVVCFTSDHGEELWDHQRWGHGQSCYEELIRVPLILRGPGVPEGATVQPAVSAVDLLPTLAELLGLPPDPAWRGKSLVGAWDNPATLTDRPSVFVQGTSNKAWPHPEQAVVHGTGKLIRKAGGGGTALYDLAGDPAETKDISEQAPERKQQLGGQLDAWLDSFPSLFGDTPSPGGLEQGEEMLEELQNMGYL